MRGARLLPFIAVCLAAGVVAGCQSEMRQPQGCSKVGEDAQRRICASFESRVDELGTNADGGQHLVFRSYCDGRERRIALRAPQPREALAEAVERRFRSEEPADGCVYAVEMLTPRSSEVIWQEAASDDIYLAHRDALQIRNKPYEVVTPLDFSAVRPRSTSLSIERLGHVYARKLRDRNYIDKLAPVRVFDVDTLVLRDGEVQTAQFHRFRHPEPDDQALIDGVRRAGQWFETMRYPTEGRFYYEYNPYRDEHVKDRYNLLRHAGSTWSIVQAYGLTGDEKFRRLAEYAFEWLEAQSRTETRQGRTIRYVVESWNRKAKLGGAGLWLLALSEHARLTGDTSNLGLIGEIANHIYLSQDPESGKFETFYDGEGLRVTDHESDYYPGEAMFGLHRARPFLSEIPVCEVTRKGLTHMLADEPREMPAHRYRFVNQWNAYTVREYRRDCDDNQFDWVWRRDLEHMLSTAATEEQQPVMAGAYLRRNGRLSTSPTRLEALTLICTELGREEPEIAERCDPVIRRVAAMQLSYQHHPRNSWLWSNPQAAHGGFAHELDRESIRIDFTQHHLSAMYNAVEFLRHVSPSGDDESNEELADRREWPFNLIGDATCDRIDGACKSSRPETK